MWGLSLSASRRSALAANPRRTPLPVMPRGSVRSAAFDQACHSRLRANDRAWVLGLRPHPAKRRKVLRLEGGTREGPIRPSLPVDSGLGRLAGRALQALAGR